LKQVLITIRIFEECLIHICETSNFQSLRRFGSLSHWIWKLKWLISFHNPEYFNRLRPDDMIDEHLIITKSIVLSFFTIFEMLLLKNVKLSHINEVLLTCLIQLRLEII